MYMMLNNIRQLDLTLLAWNSNLRGAFHRVWLRSPYRG